MGFATHYCIFMIMHAGFGIDHALFSCTHVCGIIVAGTSTDDVDTLFQGHCYGIHFFGFGCKKERLFGNSQYEACFMHSSFAHGIQRMVRPASCDPALPMLFKVKALTRQYSTLFYLRGCTKINHAVFHVQGRRLR